MSELRESRTLADPHQGRFVVVPAAYVYVLRENAGSTDVLLQWRQNTGYMDEHWAAAAAGHVERGETSFDAAGREAAEELGISDLDLAFLTTMHRTQGALPIDERVDFFFTARSWSGQAHIMEPEKCGELRWCRLDDLPEPVVPHERVVLTALNDGNVDPYMSYGFKERA